MTRLSSAIFAFVLVLPTFANAAPAIATPPMPHTLYGRDPRHPVFLAAADVFDDQGRIRHDAPLTSSDLRTLNSFLNLPRTNGCISAEEAYLDYVNPPERRDLTSAIDVSDFVVETKVVNRSFGFMEGIPGQLLQLQKLTELKRDAGEIRPLYYIFVPVADFTAGGLHFCKIDRRYGQAPQIGDTVFVFADRRFTANDYINVVNELGFVRASPDGSLRLPRALRGDVPAVNADDIRRLVRGDKGKPEAQ